MSGTFDLDTTTLTRPDELTDNSVFFGAVGGQAVGDPDVIPLSALKAAIVGMFWREAWVTATDYVKSDGVENDGSSYLCLLLHTADASNEPGVGVDWETYWSLFASQGDTGAGATVAVGTVTTLAPGEDATVADVGTPGAAVLNFGIPEGIQGDPGDAATVAVGTVTTVAAGQPATVTNSGTSDAAVLNFEIPEGVPGSGLANVVEDTTPQLGGDLDVNGNNIGGAAGVPFTSQPYSPQATLTDQATIAWNLTTQPSAIVTLADNRTLDAPTNQKAGSTYVLVIKQDGTGGRTLAWNAAYKFPGGIDPTLSTGVNDVDVVSFVSDGTNMYGVAALDFS